MSGIRSHRDLKVWQQGIELTKEIYEITRYLPEQKRYGLASQLQRSAVSIPSNIAEGQGRKGKREFRQFLRVALGSLVEMETHLIISVELNYLKMDLVEPLLPRLSRCRG